MAAKKPKKDPGKLTRSEAARMLGRRGGLKGGKARAAALSSDERIRIAKMGAEARAAKYGKLTPKKDD